MVVTMMISNGGLEPTQASKPPADTEDDDDGDHRSCTCGADDDHAGMHLEFLRHLIPKSRSAITDHSSTARCATKLFQRKRLEF